jgi:hypothetical protein
MKKSPTQMSLALLRKLGYSVAIVEKWVPASPAGFKGPIVKHDAFNFGDILGMKVGVPGALLVQTTTGSNAAARVNKIREIAEAGIWLAAGNRIEVHGWRKVLGEGGRPTWQCRRIQFVVQDGRAVTVEMEEQ